jgi:hypothetical protein
MEMEFLLSPIILIALVLFVAWPLLTTKKEAATVRRSEFEIALEEKESLIATLKDIEMDYRMGKLSDVDYQHLKDDFESRAVKSLQRLETLEKKGSRKQP